jgi:hypothetical protein
MEGYRPEAHQQITQNRLNQELELVANLSRESTNWRRGGLRDVIAAREMIIELNEMITTALISHGMHIGQLVGDDREKIRAFASCMPGCEVAIEMKTQYHRNPSKRWTVNDIYDIDALALAVPYCDVVFTDAEARAILAKARLEGRMNTGLPRTPSELIEVLHTLPSPSRSGEQDLLS